MNRSEKYEAKTSELIQSLIDKNHFELVDVEFVKEGSDWYLRVYIDKEGGITVDDCELVKENYIDEPYIFEVSSPGLTRPLKKEKDYERSVGKLIDIKVFKPVDNCKEFTGILKAYNNNTVTIEVDGKEICFDRKNLALIRLAFC